MATIFISLGSNIEREKHTRAGVEALQKAFGKLRLSSVYESEAVGFKGDAFYNMVIACDTGLPVHEANAVLRAIEDAHGRDRSGPKFSSRTLDLDLLLYDDLVLDENGLVLPRGEILKNAFVLWPLAEIAPDRVHPQAGKRYAELWQAFDKSRENLQPIPFSFPSIAGSL
ncbi:MAG TPA: 2-amino-4-hydroxy-6-hydroxymethyldihydropteridine diphosphokinase [Gammaproteobacteria bacterium]|nr:2-amino-4-hydroxy-6-hydroxymethyldihydropteridine diphosphokinase [Gammaproteobacteria bacterium]